MPSAGLPRDPDVRGAGRDECVGGQRGGGSGGVLRKRHVGPSEEPAGAGQCTATRTTLDKAPAVRTSPDWSSKSTRLPTDEGTRRSTGSEHAGEQVVLPALRTVPRSSFTP